MSGLRDLPSIDSLLITDSAAALVSRYGRELTLQAVREVLDQFRESYQDGQEIPHETDWFSRAEEMLHGWFEPTLQPVLNATGVILHTNLGRAPLSRDAIEAVVRVLGGYSTLEFNLANGKRGSRMVHTEDLLKRITGAEAAMVVNNNASAVLLALTALARRKRVILARSQLVEIGGGFRVPDIMKQSGAHLTEIGTTNRSHLSDYEEALQEPAAMILHVHSSNFRIIGFTSEPSLLELAQLAHQKGIWMMDDLGSGALLDTSRYGLAREPMIQDSVAAGVDVVCFSGDKLLGGPQAGILVGRKDCIDRLRKHPLARAVRADKMCLAALSATLAHYLKGEAEQKIPVWQMISADTEELKRRAVSWQNSLGLGEVVKSLSTIGGGSLPEETLPGFSLQLAVPNPDHFLARLRKDDPPVIARIENNRVIFDPRTIFPEDDDRLVEKIRNCLHAHQEGKP